MATFDQLLIRANGIRTAVVEESITAPELGQLLIDMINFMSTSGGGGEGAGSLTPTQLSQLQASLKDLTFAAQSGLVKVTLTKNDGTTVTRNIPAASATSSGVITADQYKQLQNLVSQYNSLVSQLAGKQDKLTAGSGIKIQNNVISAEGTRKVILHSTTCSLREFGDDYAIIKTLDNLAFVEYITGWVSLTSPTNRVTQRLSFYTGAPDCKIVNSSYMTISKAYLESLFPGYALCDIFFDAYCRDDYYLLRTTSDRSKGSLTPTEVIAQAGKSLEIVGTPETGWHLSELVWMGADGSQIRRSVSNNRALIFMPFHGTLITGVFSKNEVEMDVALGDHVTGAEIDLDGVLYDTFQDFLDSRPVMAEPGYKFQVNYICEDGYKIDRIDIYDKQGNLQITDSPNRPISVPDFDFVVHPYAISESEDDILYGEHTIIVPDGIAVTYNGTTIRNSTQGPDTVYDSVDYYAVVEDSSISIVSWRLTDLRTGNITFPSYYAGQPLTVADDSRYSITLVTQSTSGGGSSEDWGTFRLGIKLSNRVSAVTISQGGKTKTMRFDETGDDSYAYFMIDKTKNVNISATVIGGDTVKDWAISGKYAVLASDTNSFNLTSGVMSSYEYLKIYPNF